MTPTHLSGHVALVTGASRGIGRATSQRLAAHGAGVALVASGKSAGALEQAAQAIRGAGGKAIAIVADLGDAKARADLVARATQALGPVDIVVNNAAAIPAYAPPSRIDLPARHAMFEVNVHAPIDLAQQAIPAMRQQGWGRIVNVSSEMARQPPIPYPGPAKFVHALALYGASKAALERYTIGLAAELHGTGIHVSAVSPYKVALSEGALEYAKQVAAAHPDWLEPVEMMAEAIYLLIARELTGVVATSREILQRCQAPLHALDGKTVIGDATTVGKV